MGVGQLFRFLGVLPSFKLLSAGRDEEGSLFREYELSCPQIRCRFVETFALGFLDCNTQIEAYGTISTPHTEAAVAKTTLEI